MKRLLLLLLCACSHSEPAQPTPDVQSLNCYARAKQGELLSDVERWHPAEALEQYNDDQQRGILSAGCWLKKCSLTCE